MKTVKDLINELSELNPDLVVGLAGDEEGNSVHPYYELGYSFYREDVDRDEMFGSELYDEDDELIEADETNASAVILWP